MQPPYPAMYSQVKQGGEHLSDANNYQYRRHSTTTKRTFYKCVLQKTHNCNAAASVDKETDMIVQLNGFHNHDSDLAKKEIDKIIKDAVQTAGTSLETPKNVLGRKMKKSFNS